MDEFFAFMVIVACFIFGIIYMSMWAQKQKKQIENMAPEANLRELESKYASEIDKLKSRVATLEKIVTDNQFNLKEEIEKLDAA